MPSDHAGKWKHDGVRVIPANSLDPNTAQTPGMDRKAAINFARVGEECHGSSRPMLRGEQN